MITGTNAQSNRLRGNLIYKNKSLGIDLGNDGPTLNDDLDGDTGPNNLQNSPELRWDHSATNNRVLGVLRAMPGRAYRVEVYSGEGSLFKFAQNPITDAEGRAFWRAMR